MVGAGGESSLKALPGMSAPESRLAPVQVVRSQQVLFPAHEIKGAPPPCSQERRECS